MTDEDFMRVAIGQAQMAAASGDVPAGAVIVLGDEIIAKAHNEREKRNDPTAHAEVLAIKAAAEKLGRWRLTGCKIYVTKEPCPMCAGAIYQARLDELIFGVQDAKAGAAGSLFNITGDPRLNHRVKVKSGVLKEECRALIQDFFKARR
ncbi:MAG: tRNA adenosine(34) deaminase TadA [Actinomycetota bacterium]|nr:tRNA adenosine(34) deaminase TadA [Actinomycetota bacterium]